MVERCRCRLPLDPKPPDDLRWWWPDNTPEPEHVAVVVRLGHHPLLFPIRRQKDSGLWLERGGLGARPWPEIGICWAGNCHLVIEVVDPRVL